jgi:Protein of unknown function (DUF3533)
MNFYPKAIEKRRSPHDPEIRPKRIAFLKAALLNFGLLQVLFLSLFAYIFGSLYQQAGHIHNLNILFVDYDHGQIGEAIRSAYDKLEGTTFPSLIERPASDFPNPTVNLREEVCRARYWAAFYIASGSSDRLETALTGGNAAKTYNGSDACFLVWNEARYSTVVDSAISANVLTLSSAAQASWVLNNASAIAQSLALQDSNAVAVLANPWTLSSLNIQPTTQGSRLIYNTLVIILILIQEFFYLGTINALYIQFKLYVNLHPLRIIVYRNIISIAYCMIGSLCVTGMIWAFRADWHVNGDQFVLSWISLWLFAHSNFLALDVFTIWLPLPFVPMSLIAWIVINVTSILLPFELSPGFYRWGYALPAHEVFQVLLDIWSGGCNPQLRVALPVMFSWELLGLILTAIGVYRRCHYAVIAEENQEAAFKDRLNAALNFEHRRKEEQKAADMRGNDVEEQEPQDEEAKEKEELEDIIRKEDEKLERQATDMVERGQFGPSFPLAFGAESFRNTLTRVITSPGRL